MLFTGVTDSNVSTHLIFVFFLIRLQYNKFFVAFLAMSRVRT